MPWDPDRYHQFWKERSAPFEDLFAMIKVREGLRVVDLGCGTGELTRELAEPLPDSEVLGIDVSPEMLARTKEHERPGLRFEHAAIESVDGQWDGVFSHAAIQWVDDHRALVPRLLSLVRPGGQLVVQLPSNHRHFTQTSVIEIAQDQPFHQALNGWVRQWPTLAIEEYAGLLFEQGATDITVLEKVYQHILEDADAVADWMSGTALVPYFERLQDCVREQFMETYRERLRARWPLGPVFFPFRRTLFAATRGATS